jgi:cytochrome c oxidase subunit III
MTMASGSVKHDYHLAAPSPWPFIGALGVFIMMLGFALWMNKEFNLFGIPPFIRSWIFIGGGGLVLVTLAGWWGDIVAESVRLGEFKPVVKLSFRFGMVLFIAAEAIFFAVLFCAFFYMAAYVGEGQWPPKGTVAADPWRLTLLATLILLLSGTTVTWAHRAIQAGNKAGGVQGLLVTVLLGAAFVALLSYDLVHQPFGFGFNGARYVPLTDPAHVNLISVIGSPGAIYGSVFFLVSGFFCVHVAVGTLFLVVCLVRAVAGHFTPERHFGLEAAAWYWHFGDVVWLFLFSGVYVMTSLFAGHV